MKFLILLILVGSSYLFFLKCQFHAGWGPPVIRCQKLVYNPHPNIVISIIRIIHIWVIIVCYSYIHQLSVLAHWGPILCHFGWEICCQKSAPKRPVLHCLQAKTSPSALSQHAAALRLTARLQHHLVPTFFKGPWRSQVIVRKWFLAQQLSNQSWNHMKSGKSSGIINITIIYIYICLYIPIDICIYIYTDR